MTNKIEFSKKISDMMLKKIGSLNNINNLLFSRGDINSKDIRNFFFDNEDFEFILCLAYLALSKESIITKDKKNTDTLGRLTLKVDKDEIDKVFSSDFSNEQINIIESDNYDHVWMLDNIRDCFMHGLFEIDEDNRCFILTNNGVNRKLIAKVPFSWVIAYAKNDIAKKELTNNVTFNKIFYDKQQKGLRSARTSKVLDESILYEINISRENNSFNINEIKEDLDKLIESHMNDEISIDRYREIQELYDLVNQRNVDQTYFIRYIYVRDAVLKDIKTKEFIKKYPDVDIKFNILTQDKKKQICNELKHNMNKYYDEYDLLFEDINLHLTPYSNNLIYYLSNIINNLDEIQELYKEIQDLYKIKEGLVSTKLDKNERCHKIRNLVLKDLQEEHQYKDILVYFTPLWNMFIETTEYKENNTLAFYNYIKLLNCLINRNNIEYATAREELGIFKTTLKLLNSICLNAYGIATLVINENKYKEQYKEQNPLEYGITSYSSTRYKEYRTNLFIEFEKLIKKRKTIKNNELSLEKCKSDLGKANIIRNLLKLHMDEEKILQNIEELNNANPVCTPEQTNREKESQIESKQQELDKTVEEYCITTNPKDYRDKQLEIKRLFDEITKLTINYNFVEITDMENVINTLRNCFAHIGRVNIDLDNNNNICLRLQDYNDQGEKSSTVILPYQSLIYVLSSDITPKENKL